MFYEYIEQEMDTNVNIVVANNVRIVQEPPPASFHPGQHSSTVT